MNKQGMHKVAYVQCVCLAFALCIMASPALGNNEFCHMQTSICVILNRRFPWFWKDACNEQPFNRASDMTAFDSDHEGEQPGQPQSPLPPDATPGVDYLRVAGGVKMGDREGNLLLITPSTIYAIRLEHQSKPARTAFGRKLQAIMYDLFGYGFNQRKPGEQRLHHPLEMPQFRALGPTLAQSLEGAMLIGSIDIDSGLRVESTRLGYEFSRASGMSLIYRGTSQKQAIADFLFQLGIEVRI